MHDHPTMLHSDIPTFVVSDDVDLLTICAVLQWFDRDLLLAIADLPDRIVGVLSSEHVEALPDRPGTYRLRDAHRERTIQQLRAERAADEVRLHARALDYFVTRLGDDSDAMLEAACMYHLDQLYSLLWPREEWQTIESLIALVQAAGVTRARHRHLLTFYAACVATYTRADDRAAELFAALLDHDDLDADVHCRVLNAWALAHFNQTKYDRALELYRQTATLAEQNGSLYYQGAALINMGMIYNELEYYDQALDLTMQSLTIFRALGDQYREAIALYEIGNSALRLGRWQVARDHFDAAVKLNTALGLDARLAYVYWGQGLLYHLIGDERASEEAYQHALAIAQQPDVSNLQVVSDVLWHIGFLYHTQERWAEALAAYNRALDIATELGGTHWLSLIHFRRGNVLRHFGRLDEAFAAYHQAIESIEALRGATQIEEIKIGLLGTTQQVYEAMVLLCLELGRTADAFDYMERARSRAFLDTLVEKSPELYDSVDQPVVTLAEVQARLPQGAVLIEYFTTGVLPRGENMLNRLPADNESLREHLMMPPHVLLIAVTHDRCEVHDVPLDPNTLRPLPLDPGPGRRLLLRSKLIALLYDRLIAPVASLIAGCDTLFLIPHGPLHYVPFMALRAASGRYLLEQHGPAIAMAPSATILLRTCLRPSSSAATEYLAIGYNDRDERELRLAESEARAVADAMHGQAWLGSTPKSAALQDLGEQLRWLHVAGHAIYHPHDPLGSELCLGQDDSLSARDIIGGLNLEADLVTLSACTSGLSHVVSGDELLGLQRAFLYAGARSVVCTLWEATDIVALLVMEHFYRDLRAGQSAAVALRDAQIAVREMTGRELAAIIERWRTERPEHAAQLGEFAAIAPDQLDQRLFAQPFYWAPFMLIGRP